MSEEKRPTLTLRRKPTTDVCGNSAPSTAGDSEKNRHVPGKKKVVVSQPPAWKARKQAQEEKEQAERAAAKEARRQEKARLWAERQAQEREAKRAAKRKPQPEPKYRSLMPLEEAITLLAQCWPALVQDGRPVLLAINIRQAMVDDIRQRGLNISVKKLKRCLCAITRSDVYLGAMMEGAWRTDIEGQPVARITADEASFATDRRAQEHVRLARQAEYELKHRTDTETA